MNLEWEPNPLGHLPVTLRKEEDFDQVVLAISVAGLPDICAELIADEANPRFGAMIKNSHTCMTQAFQLWMNRPVPALAWPFRENSIMTAYVEPLDTYANMSYLRAREAWPPEARVESIAYFCGVIEDRHDDTQQTTNGRAKANAIAYLQGGARGIWPNCHMKAGGFDWGLLVGADANAGDAPGPQSFDSQYWLANFQRTERYVLTPAGSVKYRLAADESGYENLYLAGDWTKTGLDAGCVEAATMSGMQAARVICGSPRYIIGEDQKWLSGMSSTRPPEAALQYVEYGGLATVPSPVDCEGATLYSFFLEADHTVLDDLCRRVFTQPSGGQIDMRPLGRHVMLSFGVIDKVRPQREPWSLMGYASERQAAFWIPVVTVRNEGGRMVAVSLGWFIPYMWVDNPLSLAGGREIYGYNKNWGWIKLPSDDGDIGLTLDAYGGNYTGDEPAGRHPLIEVAPVSSGSFQRSGERWDDLDTVLAEVQRALGTGDSEFVDLPGLELPDQIYEAILGRSGPPQIFLKQFRSVSDGERASQQQITDAGSTVKRLVGWPLLGKYDFKLHELDSHPVAKELGVHSHQVTPLAFEFDVDFVLNEGQVVWQAPAD